MSETYQIALTASALFGRLPNVDLGPSLESVSATMLQSMHTVGQSLSVLIPRTRQKPSLPDLINRLPPEAISEIMQFAMSPSKKTPMKKDHKLFENTPVSSLLFPLSPFPLTQVCRRWRYIAQHTTQLWRSIFIAWPRKRLVYRTELWMQFVGNYPLDVIFSQRENPTEDEIKATVEIINILGRRSRQWSTMEFHFEQETLPPLLVAQINQLSMASCRLKNATISHMFKFSNSNDVKTTWKALNQIQSLKKLNWFSADGVSRPSLSQLQSLTINGISARELIEGLNLCENLQDLDVQVFTGAPIDEDEIRRIRPTTQSHLQHAALKGDSRDIKAFLHSFTFPSLFSIELSSLDSSTCASLWGLLIRSRCTLSKLVLGVDGVEGTAVADWFELDILQSLETMVIVGAEITDAALLMLTCPPVRGHRSSYFTNLKHLSLGTCSPDIDDAAFIRMLGSRLFTAVGDPAKVELVTAAFSVFNKTSTLRMYEDMCMSLVKNECNVPSPSNWRGWNGRSVTIQQS